MTTEPKQCAVCGQIKTEFRKGRNDRPTNTCQKCYNKQANDYKYRNRPYWMLTCARRRAKVAGLPFNLTVGDIIIPEYCPVLGIKLEPGSKKYHAASPSLDRIVPEKGYVKGNVAVISFRANRLKGDGTIEELERVISWLKNQS